MQKQYQFAVRKINTAAAPLPSRKILISALQLSLGTVGKRFSCVTTLETGYTGCKGVSKKGQSLSAFQLAADTFIVILLQQSFGNNSCFLQQIPTFYFSSYPKQTIFQPTDTFLRSSIFQNARSKFQTMRSIQTNSDFYLQPEPSPHTLHIWIYANNFLLKTHFWYSGNWSRKKNLFHYAEKSFSLRVIIGLGHNNIQQK